MQTIDIHSETDAEANSSVGKANPNTSIYIVDESGRSVPQGIPGEICVGGVGVALGYLDKDVSAQRFVTNTFATSEEKARGWNLMYRTGDKGLIRADGSLQFMGRMDGDTTIKLRGLRIDLDDVANVMLREGKGSIADAIVTVRGDPAFLVAHVVLSQGSVADSASLQQLANSLPLPQYMKPAIVIPLEQLPLSNNGKIDRRAVEALPLPTLTSSSNSQTLVSSGRKPTLAEGEMRLIWHKVLSQTGLSDNAKLEPGTDFFHVGGNSLLLVKLQSAIQTSMGVSLSLREMYRSSTLEGMTALATERNSGEFVSETIDWEAETALPRSINIDQPMTLNPPRTGQGLEILMTGSLAFLGSRILRSLLGNAAVARVHCVAVDPDSMDNHIKDDRVTVYPGSLGETMFGLSSDTYHQLQNTVDAIILAGSEGHCLNNYLTLRAPNVTSTQQMGRFAFARGIPIHYISSNRVTLLDDRANAALPPVSVKDHRPPVDGSEGFTAAKWASEVFLENLSAAATKSSGSGHGGHLPVTIHRPCAIVGEEAPIEDALNALLRYSKLIAAVPSVSKLNVNGYFDFLPVESVASDIAASAVSLQTSQSGVEFRHYSSGTRVTPGEFAAYMQKTYGGEFRELELEDWIGEARKEGIEELIVLYLQAIVDRGGRITFPFMGNTV
jgi:aspyridone synthetase (hybrid polyketide synthase/nonribosomal peptide synthetase)